MPDSSSRGPTAESLRSDEVLGLGRKIVTELGLDDSNDTLARWMAHYIAELIQLVETAPPEEQPTRKSECATAILELWEHRRQFPDGRRPFEDFDAVLRVLESLDPENATGHYFSPVMEATESSDEDTRTLEWLRLARGLDKSARILIRYCVARAAEVATDKSREWVAQAEAAGVSDRADLSVFRALFDEVELTTAVEPSDSERKLIEDRIERLSALSDIAAEVEADLRSRLKRGDRPH